MPEYTQNLNLFKYDTVTDAKQAFNIDQALNNNFDKIDEAIGNINTLPPQTDNSGKFLTTDGISASWGNIPQPDISSKADISLSNLDENGRNYITSAGFPSTRYETLTAGASGTVYTAPANGYYHTHGLYSANNGFISLTNVSLDTSQEYFNSPLINVLKSGTSGSAANIFIPTAKGQKIKLEYRSSTFQPTSTYPYLGIHFIYAEGEE